ncbi:MAG: hypothetical protein AAGN82_04870 [Myxococcota bacterium]
MGMRTSSMAIAAWTCSACAPTAAEYVRDKDPTHPSIEYVAQQEVLTPLPMRVRLPSSYQAEHVVALVRTWGSGTWQPVELARQGHTWTGEVSCRQVSTVTGPTRYFFVALDHAGEIVLDSGSPEFPYVATVVGELTGGARGLPGAPTPKQCHDVADCPPDFVGCPRYRLLRPACRSDLECASGECKWDGYCALDETPGYAFEEADAEAQLEIVLQRVQRHFQASR